MRWLCGLVLAGGLSLACGGEGGGSDEGDRADQAGSGGVGGVSGSSGGGAREGGGEGPAGAAGAGDLPSCAARIELEGKMRASLDVAAADPEVTMDPAFALALEADDGHRFVYEHGDATLDTIYESASTSKWVAAVVILDLVDRGLLTLDDDPGVYLPFWEIPGVTLAQLLSFTSGISREAPCINLPGADFAQCVERIYENNLANAAAPGTTFEYSSSHLQIAGLMAMRAADVESFGELFTAWQEQTGLFPTGAFDLPSAANPRLAGGMHWRGREYLEFLRAIYDGVLLSTDTRQDMLSNQRGAAEVVASPAQAIGQDWAYGFGNWLECATAVDGRPFDCNSGERNSSPGAYGAYPFIDFEHRYIGLLARQGTLGSFVEGNAIFATVADAAALWAAACSP